MHGEPVQVLCVVCIWGGIFIEDRALVRKPGAWDVVLRPSPKSRAGVAGTDEYHASGDAFVTGSFESLRCDKTIHS